MRKMRVVDKNHPIYIAMQFDDTPEQKKLIIDEVKKLRGVFQR